MKKYRFQSFILIGITFFLLNAGGVSSPSLVSAQTPKSPLQTNILSPFSAMVPTTGKIVRGFYTGHHGIDVSNAKLPAIWSAQDGTVSRVVNNCSVSSGRRCGGGYGNYVVIDHANGYQTLYAHLQYVTAKVGDKVHQGDVIGKMGKTGNVWSNPHHLHFELRKDGIKQNPGKFFSPSPVKS